ncbi:MAG: hypothetical protein Q8O89_02160 [Nanoarchaeota archaeon]|nr:hypothetical protein [Nanoarchaeota archaeon]
MNRKKGQVDASNAAALVALIAALIILYIMFLPPDVRVLLLDGNDTNATSGSSTSAQENNTLLDVVPGKLSFISSTRIEHPIPSVSLYKSTNARIIKSENPFYIKKGWFDEKTKSLTFAIDDLQNTNNALFSYSASKYAGNLIVKLNGNEIFNSDISGNPQPIILSKELLSKDNTLEFSTSSVGLAFWRTNEFNIVNAKITADITDISRQQSRNVFLVSSTEKHNLERVELEFNPNCDMAREEVGVLEIFVNGVNVYSAVPDCKILNAVKELSSGALSSGENNIVFKTNKGSYLVDQIQLISHLRDEPSAVYYFELSKNQFNDIINDRKKLNITMEFVDRGYEIEADLVINGHKTAIPPDVKRFYGRSIPKDWLREDTNYINIQPKVTFDAVKLKLELTK